MAGLCTNLGLLDKLADFLSCGKPPPGEWQLHQDEMHNIWDCFSRAETDLFGSEETTHCPHWFSWMEETSPLRQDALAHNWLTGLFYAFAPLPTDPPLASEVSLAGPQVALGCPFQPGRTQFPFLEALSQPIKAPFETGRTSCPSLGV